MATYEDIYGKRVKEFDSDPTLDSTYEGQVWYNSTSGTLKSLVAFGAWRSGGNLSQDTKDIAGQSGGTLTAAIKVAGNMPSGKSNVVDLYDGTAWTNTTNYPIAAEGVGCFGVQTAQVSYGGDTGSYVNTVNEWNGSSWTGGTAYPQTISRSGGCGTEPAGLAIGGYDGSASAVCKEYNGSSWTAAGGLSTAAPVKGASGSQTACLSTNSAGTENYDGTSWTAGTNLSSPRGFGVAASRNGTSTFLIIAGGSTPPGAGSNLTELYDGNAWSTQPTMSTARGGLGGAGTASATIVYGGEPGSGDTEASEEWDFSINTVVDAAWASGGSFPINNRMQAQAGPQTAAISYGGRTYPGPNAANNNASTYNGTSWTAIPSISNARYFLCGAKEGTQTAAMCCAGIMTTGATNSTEEYDGSSWTGGGAYPISTSTGDHGAGTQTAAIIAGGYGGTPVPYTDQTSTYDGSSWTALSSPSNLNTARSYGSMCGPQTAALLVSGQPGTGGVESWNGSAWTAVPALGTTRNYAGASGTNTSALAWGGELPPGAAQTNVSESWNGSAWSASSNMATPGYSGGASGSSSSALATGGTEAGSGRASATQQFTGASTTVGPAETLTSS